MLLPLILPSLNISSLPSPRNTPLTTSANLTTSPPDITTCHPFYSNPAAARPLNIPSCMQLINDLPQGNDPIRYYQHPQTLDERRHALPLIISRRNNPCQIQIHASGPASSSITGGLSLKPAHLRNLAASLIWTCVGGHQVGGAATSAMQNSLDWLTDIDTVFPGPAPDTTTFLSMLVWNGDRGVGEGEGGGEGGGGWNPGNQDPVMGAGVYDYVHGVYEGLKRETKAYIKLDEVLFDLLFSTRAMRYGGGVNWFDDNTPDRKD